MFIRTFEGYSPPDRYDSIPFIEVQVLESEDLDGSYATIDSITIAPADADPSHPATRNFTTPNATLESGWYLLRWVDVNGATFDSEPTFYPSSARPGSLAMPADVARVLRIGEIDPASEDEVLAALETAEEWARSFIGDLEYGTGGTVTVSKFDVPVDGHIRVPGPPTAVSVLYYAGAAPSPLEPNAWTYDGKSVYLRMGWDADWYDPRYGTDAFRRAFVEVRVTCTVSGTVSPIVRDAVAYAAAALWTRGPRVGKGLVGETIGDYGYTLAQADQSGDPFFSQARSLLRPLRGSGVSVT